MCSVRQIVALYEIDRIQWQRLSSQCLYRVASVENVPPPDGDHSRIVANIIKVLVRAMACRLNHLGGFDDDDHYGGLDVPRNTVTPRLPKLRTTQSYTLSISTRPKSQSVERSDGPQVLGMGRIGGRQDNTERSYLLTPEPTLEPREVRRGFHGHQSQKCASKSLRDGSMSWRPRRTKARTCYRLNF